MRIFEHRLALSHQILIDRHILISFFRQIMTASISLLLSHAIWKLDPLKNEKLEFFSFSDIPAMLTMILVSMLILPLLKTRP